MNSLEGKVAIITGGTQGLGITTTTDTGFGNLHEMFGNQRSHPHGTFLVHRERHEITLVDPDEGRPGINRDSQFMFVVHLHEGIDVDRPRNAEQFVQFVGTQCGRNEKNAVGPHDARVAHVPWVDREVLPDDRQVAHRP